MLNFHDIIKGRHCRHFSVKKFNLSQKAQISHACFWWWLQYVLQVWWNLVNFKKMLKFYYISRAGTVTIFLWKKFNFSEWAQISHACFWWWFQYVLQVWWNLVNFEKMLKFHNIIKGLHARHFSVKKFSFSEKAQISHACFWWWLQYVLQVWCNLVNFEKCWNFMIFLGPALSAFFCEKFNFSE